MYANITIRLAVQSDLDWINQQYDSVGFIHSQFDNEIIAIAETDGTKCGIGRLVKIEEDVFELGGMYVNEEYRSRKIATKIIEFLLNSIDRKCTIYCLPFTHLEHFYQRFGLQICTDLTHVPQKVVDKLAWCNQTYEHEVSCLVRNK